MGSAGGGFDDPLFSTSLIGRVPKWPNGADCKSAGLTPSGVRIPPLPLGFCQVYRQASHCFANRCIQPLFDFRHFRGAMTYHPLRASAAPQCPLGDRRYCNRPNDECGYRPDISVESVPKITRHPCHLRMRRFTQHGQQNQRLAVFVVIDAFDASQFTQGQHAEGGFDACQFFIGDHQYARAL